MLPNNEAEHDYNQLAKSDFEKENRLSEIEIEWEKYVNYLKDKYSPQHSSSFTFTCYHHKKLHELITGQKL